MTQRLTSAVKGRKVELSRWYWCLILCQRSLNLAALQRTAAWLTLRKTILFLSLVLPSGDQPRRRSFALDLIYGGFLDGRPALAPTRLA